MRRGGSAVVLLAALSCHSSSPPTPARAASTVAPPPSAPARARTPLDALADEADRADLSLLVTRDANVVFERRPSTDPHAVTALARVIERLTVADEPAIWNVSPQLQHERVFRPLGIAEGEHTSFSMSVVAAERLARAFADDGMLDGKRAFPKGVLAAIVDDDAHPVWEKIGEGELAVVTRRLFDSWRAIPSIERASLTALEPLVDSEMPIDDLVPALETKLGKASDHFRNEVSKAGKKLFERRWRSTVGFGAFSVDRGSAVVVLTRTKLIAVSVTPREDYAMRSLIPLLRAFE